MFETVWLETLDDAAQAITTMQVRGAPLIGMTAAYGLCFALKRDASDAALDARLRDARGDPPHGRESELGAGRDEAGAGAGLPPAERAAAAYAKAGQLADEDVETCRLIGHHGQKIIAGDRRAQKGGRVNILTHCNAGWLACVDWGTALSPIYQAHDAGMPVHVWVDETRPRNQGAGADRLRAWRARRSAHGHRRQCRRPSHAARQSGPLHRGLRPADGGGRRGEQDRHLSEGARGEG